MTTFGKESERLCSWEFASIVETRGSQEGVVERRLYGRARTPKWMGGYFVTTRLVQTEPLLKEIVFVHDRPDHFALRSATV